MRAFFTLILLVIVALAWCPWFESAEARQLIYNKVRESQSTLITGCILTIKPNTFQKVPFGYKQAVDYNCTVNADFLTEGQNDVYVLFFKQVLNVPHPVIK